MTRSALLAVAALLALGLPTRAGVIVVAQSGGGDFTTLPAAIAAASSGDILLVRAGDYAFSGSLANKGSLTLVADPQGSQPGLGLSVSGLPAGATLVVRGFFTPSYFGNTLQLQDCAGAVLLEDCDGDFDFGGGIFGVPGPPGAYVSNCAAVTFSRCTLRGQAGANQLIVGPAGSTPSTPGGAGAQIIASHVAFQDCVLTGGAGGFGGFIHGANGGAGLSLTGSSALLSGTVATGGKGGDGCNSQLDLWCQGGPGAALDAASMLQALEGSWVGGAAGKGGTTGQFGLPGPGFVGPAGQPLVFDGAARSLQLSSPVREHQAGTLALSGVQGDLVLAFTSFDGGSLPLPGKKGWLVLGPDLHGPFVLGTIVDASGNLALPFTAPDLVSGLLEGQTFLLQGVFAGPAGLVLGSVSSFTLVDQSL